MRRYKGLTGKKVSIKFVWYDIWIGVFIDTAKNKIYICPFPMIVIVIEDRYPKWWKSTPKPILRPHRLRANH